MSIFSKVLKFYRDGFCGMTIGKSLWLLILIKVAILFLVLKMFFFPDQLKMESENRELDKNEAVREILLERTK